jgi:hypothetical protein
VPSSRVQAFKLMAEAKVAAIQEWLDEQVVPSVGGSSGRKALVFTHHHTVIDPLVNYLEKKVGRGGYITVTGKTPQSQREALSNQFKEQPSCGIALLSLTACGSGLNLVCADTVVFAELCWSPANLEQAAARVHRIGQTSRRVNLYYLVGCPAGGAGGMGALKMASPDELMYGAVLKKADAVDLVVDGMRGGLRADAFETPSRRQCEAANVGPPPARARSADAGGAGGEHSAGRKRKPPRAILQDEDFTEAAPESAEGGAVKTSRKGDVPCALNAQ